MSVTYSTNFMGPVSTKWYSDRGLTRKVSKLLEEDQRFGDLKAGDTWTYDEITTEYACGRIDIRGVLDAMGFEMTAKTIIEGWKSTRGVNAS